MSLLSRLSPDTKAALRAQWNRWRHPQAQLGPGTYVQRGAQLAAGTVAGRHCAVLRGAEVRSGTRLGDQVVVGGRSRIGKSTTGDHCTLEPGVELFNCSLGDHVTLQRDASVVDAHVGRYSYIGRQARLNLVTVGSFSSIGPDTLAGLGEHPVEFGSTSPAFYSTRRQCGATFASADAFPERRPIVIGHDVWLGARVVVRDGVTIGHGAIVAAGAVVTHDVTPYTIVGGTPAKLIRPRFDEPSVARLLALAWWSWPDHRLQAAQPYLASHDLCAFLDWAEAAAAPGVEAAALR